MSEMKHWTDDFTGLNCLVGRSPIGVVVGYVGVTVKNEWHGFDGFPDLGDEVEEITFCGRAPDDFGRPEGENLWWIGFDSMHWGMDGRGVDEAEESCAGLAEVLARYDTGAKCDPPDSKR